MAVEMVEQEMAGKTIIKGVGVGGAQCAWGKKGPALGEPGGVASRTGKSGGATAVAGKPWAAVVDGTCFHCSWYGKPRRWWRKA